jgi:chromosome segregation ATPase
MNNDDKILNVLEELKAGQQTLQADVRTLKDGQKALETGQKVLQTDVASVKDVQQQESKDIAALKSGQEHQGKLLNGITATVGTILEEQQAQRIDIRSLHTEVHETRGEVKGEIRAARDEAKRDSIDLKATVVKKIQSLDRRTTNIEEQSGIENPEKH